MALPWSLCESSVFKQNQQQSNDLCHNPFWTDQGGVAVSSEFPWAELR